MEERTGTALTYNVSTKDGTLRDTDSGNSIAFSNPANIPDVAIGNVLKYVVIYTPARVVNILKEKIG